MLQGVVLVDKPIGWTSFDVVNYVRRIVASYEGKKTKSIKVGHSGTLDPFASGLLILLIGRQYTKRAAEFTKRDKTYDITFKLGEVSSTGDPEGEITFSSDHRPSLQQLEDTINSFEGEIQQIPPIFSAIKVNGKRAYKLARQGEELELPPRGVVMHRLKLINYDYPEVRLVAEVSSGTYIRSLVRDIGVSLGSGAYTTALRRTSINGFDVSKACSPQAIDAENIEQLVYLKD